MPDKFNPQIIRKKAVLTQGNAGATDCVITITNGGTRPAVIDFLSIGKDNYAAGRTMTAVLENAAGTILGHLSAPAGVSIDNQFLPVIPSRLQTGAPAADDRLYVGNPNFNLYPGGVVRITGAALAQTETLTVFVRGMGDDVTVANGSGAGVTASITDA